jgi:hypothetical protein
MKTVLLIATLLCLGSIIYGFTLMDTSKELADTYIGFGTLFLFLVIMPLFIFTASKGKKLKDYMLNEENIRKMNPRSDSKKKKK